MDQDKESWLGKEGNRARFRHQIAVKVTRAVQIAAQGVPT